PGRGPPRGGGAGFGPPRTSDGPGRRTLRRGGARIRRAVCLVRSGGPARRDARTGGGVAPRRPGRRIPARRGTAGGGRGVTGDGRGSRGGDKCRRKSLFCPPPP